VTADVEVGSQVADHVVTLPGSPDWVLWRCMCFRSSGFPADRVNVVRQTGRAGGGGGTTASRPAAQRCVP